MGVCMHISGVTCDNCRPPWQTYQGVGIVGQWTHTGTCAAKDCPVCEANKPKLEPVPKVSVNEKQLGWQCPKCSTVWAPFVRKCEGCKP